ncbi:very short patch repair endonuclease [Exiguobacterium sp. s129]|uniref:very short patch repair endonuclease n=1 Tax=Exiguobacterium sp. s129 TaxID=2751264 RepID=UPI001BE523F0|nr:very short patch repair endonuclease [Exiguobacterium sp. s129]
MSATNKGIQKVRGKDTKMELKVRKALWHRGLRYRKNYKKLLGTPDIAFPNQKLVIFLDSCFWHGCPLHYREPKSNQEFWNEKIKRNQERDAEQTEHYVCQGWTILRFWEHEIASDFERVINDIVTTYDQLNKKRNRDENRQELLDVDDLCD